MADGGVGEAALAEEVIGATEAGTTAAEATTAADAAAAAAAAGTTAGAAGSLGTASGALGTGTGIAGLSPEAASTLAQYNPEIASQLAQTQAAATPGGISSLATNTGWGEAAVPQELQYTAPEIGPATQVAGPAQLSGSAPAASTTSPYDLSTAARSAPTGPSSALSSAGSTNYSLAAPDYTAGANYGANMTGSGDAIGKTAADKGMLEKAGSWVADNPGKTAMAVMGIKALTQGPNTVQGQQPYNGPLSKYRLSQNYQPYQYKSYAAGGGVIEQMSNANSIGQNTGYPTADIQQGAYATPWQTPISRNVVADSSDSGVDSFTGDPRGMAKGGIANLGGYSDGGRMLKGPGDGMSDNIPAVIGGKQPARLADGEFVVPADVVSHLGNGSTDAGAKQLYKMMDKVRAARTGTKKQGKEINPNKYMPS